MVGTEAAEPDRDAARVAAILDAVIPRARPFHMELYHRVSTKLRVDLEPADDRPRVQLGREEGVAVRLAGAVGAPCFAFAATTGADRAAVSWALKQAAAQAPLSARWGPGWSRGSDGTTVDRAPSLRLPSPARMEAWLRESTAGIGRASTGPAWVEAAVTIEVIAAEGGLLAARARSRAWAMATVGPNRLPRITAADSLERLGAEVWSLPATGEDGPKVEPNVGAPVVLLPEPASVLVSALVRTLHGPNGRTGRPAGPAWRLADDPVEPRGLSGGVFDDAGFPTARTVLADGRTVVGLLDGQGHLRRESYRDPPRRRHTSLVVAETPVEPPTDHLSVHDLKIHPLAPDEWALQLEGHVFASGAPAGVVPGSLVRVRPSELIGRCVGTVGSPRMSYLGVLTPGIVLDALD